MKYILTVNDNIKTGLYGFFSLFGSGLVATIGFILITSGRWDLLDLNVSNNFVLFVQWQTLGNTIAKMGIDYKVFALVSSNSNIYLNPIKFICKTVVPASLLYSFFVLFYFSVFSGFIAFISIIADVYSIIIISDLNARKQYMTVAVANIFNYPLLFIFIFILHSYITVSFNVILILFASSSIIRLIYLKIINTMSSDNYISFELNIAFQQILNYLLFRLDQILILLIPYLALNKSYINEYLFMSKFPELASGVMVFIGTVSFPAIYFKKPVLLKNIIQNIFNHKLLIFLYIVSIFATILFYVDLYVKNEIGLFYIIPFYIHSIAILVVNNITYSMIRQNHISCLNRNLIISIIFGILFIVILNDHLNMNLLAWLIPIQLAVFIIISILIPWSNNILVNNNIG